MEPEHSLQDMIKDQLSDYFARLYAITFSRIFIVVAVMSLVAFSLFRMGYRSFYYLFPLFIAYVYGSVDWYEKRQTIGATEDEFSDVIATEIKEFLLLQSASPTAGDETKPTENETTKSIT
jgi:hypothetical protein